jgi:hypothetical protein
LKIWKNFILTWVILLISIIAYSASVDGGISADDYSKYLGILFWGVTIIVSIYPLGFIIFNRRLLDSMNAAKLFFIALLCPFVGSLFVYIKLRKLQNELL